MLYRPRFTTGRFVRLSQPHDQYHGKQNAIVVALDGEAAAEKALPYAVHLARRWKAPLHLAQVITTRQYGMEANRRCSLIASGYPFANRPRRIQKHFGSDCNRQR